MCLYPKKITNRKYTVNDKNGGNVPLPPLVGYDENGIEIYDERVLTVNVGCGRCQECCNQRAMQWQVRLSEEIKDWKYMYFVTFTFSPKGLREVCFRNGLSIDKVNAAATYALRKSLELYRKYNKKSYRHFFVTELGHEGTERIHMHGILFMDTEQDFEIIERKKDGNMCRWKYWRYGNIFVGDYVNQASVNYMVKYMQKIDTDHKNYVGIILASPGIGRRFIDHLKEAGKTGTYKYRPKHTKDYYRLNNGCKVKLPKYFSNKFLNEDERELKWREFMDADKTTIKGNTYFHKETDNYTIGRIYEKAQEINKQAGFGDDSKEWKKMEYNVTKAMLQAQHRRENMEKMAEALRKRNIVI